jgi:hypothetical protein
MFGPFWDPTTNILIGRHEKKRLCYFVLRILLPIQIQLLKIENPKNPKIDSHYRYCMYNVHVNIWFGRLQIRAVHP